MADMHVIYVGSHACDCCHLNGKLVDLQSSARRGLKAQKKGFADTVLELAHMTPEARAAAGIPAQVYEEFLSCNEIVERIDEKLPIARKLVEVLEESRAHYVDARENHIGIMVDALRSRAKRRRDTSALAAFETTIDYFGQQATKAARTRQRKQVARQGEAKAAPHKGNGAGDGSNDELRAPASARTVARKSQG